MLWVKSLQFNCSSKAKHDVSQGPAARITVRLEELVWGDGVAALGHGEFSGILSGGWGADNTAYACVWVLGATSCDAIDLWAEPGSNEERLSPVRYELSAMVPAGDVRFIRLCNCTTK